MIYFIKKWEFLYYQVNKLKQAGCEKVFAEKISGFKDDLPKFKELLNQLRAGDIICVVRLDRLGRRMVKLVELINNFKEKGIEFISLDNNINTSNPVGMLLFSICAAFSEMERELIRERVKAGLEVAVAKGRKGGRPKVMSKKQIQKARSLKISGKLSVKEICKLMGISRSVFYRAIKDDN